MGKTMREARVVHKCIGIRYEATVKPLGQHTAFTARHGGPEPNNREKNAVDPQNICRKTAEKGAEGSVSHSDEGLLKPLFQLGVLLPIICSPNMANNGK
jgi:hypothetical protein